MARPESIEMIARLIAFDTTSRNSNLPLIEFARAHLEALGASCRTTFDETGKKANLFATLGPRDRPGYILSGHTDVVPAKAEAWTSNPFGLAERDGRLYGRGACDMKGFVGIVLALVPDFVRRGLKGPLHIALSYDEEIGCVGVRKLIADLDDHERGSLGCFVGEPTRMRVVLGHKGKETWRCRVTGRAAHASEAPRCPSAIEGVARAIAHLYDAARAFQPKRCPKAASTCHSRQSMSERWREAVQSTWSPRRRASMSRSDFCPASGLPALSKNFGGSAIQSFRTTASPSRRSPATQDWTSRRTAPSRGWLNGSRTGRTG
jgi:acetylornithine deacetylase/succinyl-diaminopimelate desuccinylase-like protein